MIVPQPYQICNKKVETHDSFTLTLKHLCTAPTPFLAGQYNMLYVFGYGEVAISLSGSPCQKGELVHTIKAVGAVTEALQRLQEQDTVGIRGPFGNGWPLDRKTKDVLLIAGGIGIAPLRSALYKLIEHRDQYRSITLLYGARSPDDLLYQNEILLWEKDGITVRTCVDRADADFKGDVGVVTTLIGKNLPDPQNTLVLTCGPEIMLKFAIHELMRYGAAEENIFLSLERNMQCSTGFCGHCQLGPYFLCKDGPIFSYDTVKDLLQIKEL
jgi:NAD(P)H-flavin reductase